MELQVFTGGVPAAAQRKITRDKEDIRQVAQALFSLEAARDAVNEDVPCGASAPILSSAGQMAPRGGAPGQRQGFAHHRGGLLQAAAKVSLDPDALWNSLEGEAEWVGEDGLPEIGSFPPPDQP